MTDLLSPPRIVHLRNRHKHELPPVTVEDSWKAFQGNAWHDFIDRNIRKAAAQGLACYQNRFLSEAKFWELIAGRKITGKLDTYDAREKVLYDYKVTSTYKAILGDHTDWEIQLNAYAWFLSMNAHDVEHIRIVAIHPEWKKFDMMRDPKYPRAPIHEIELNLWTPVEQFDFIEGRVQALVDSEGLEDDALPECSPEDTWEKPTKYAVMVPGGKVAKRVTESEADAHSYVEWNNSQEKRKPIKDYSVEVRPGGRMRCEEYCRVNFFCNQYQEYLAKK